VSRKADIKMKKGEHEEAFELLKIAQIAYTKMPKTTKNDDTVMYKHFVAREVLIEKLNPPKLKFAQKSTAAFMQVLQEKRTAEKEASAARAAQGLFGAHQGAAAAAADERALKQKP
jgi:hypothetical protein